MKTAVEWLINEIDMQYPDINVKNKEWMIDKAKEMEKEQIVKHSVELTKILISNPFETSGKTPTELMDNYFKETFKQ